jgi:serine/threonine-protein kinase
MSPEQACGREVDFRTDIYALGVILYQILTLEAPYRERRPQALAEEHRRGVVPPRQRAPHREIPEEVEAICLKAMALDPVARYAQAEELAAAVEAFVTGSKRREQAELRHRAGEEARQRLERAWTRRDELRAEIDRLAEQIKPYDNETRKGPLWRCEDELFATELAAEEALAETVDRLSQAVSVDPTFLAPQDRLADLHLRLVLEAEARGDRREQLFQRRQVERFHRGRHAVILDGRGLLTLRPRSTATTVRGFWLEERGKRILHGRPLELPGDAFDTLSLPMGSYLFELEQEGCQSCALPVCVGRGEKVELLPRLFPPAVVGERFVHIPAGPFIYGGDPVALNAGERQVLALDDFFIGRYPLTAGEYLEFLNDLVARDPRQAQSHVPRTKPDGGYLWEPDSTGRFSVPKFDADGNPMHVDAPVMGVSFFDAQAYCNWRSERDRIAYRLPTEQEWEKAARGADGRFFPWGNGFDPTFCKMALSRPGRPQPEPVGSFPVDTSVFGMQDCAGAIREWTDSFYDPGKETRVLRGGAWYFNPHYCRLAFRHGYLPHIVFTNFGFRLAKTPPR